MANPEHLAKLKEGVKAWSLWRKLNPKIRPDLSEADLIGANLSDVNLVETDLERANLTDCYVYGISAWDVRLEGAIQSNLVITPPDESPIQVDNL